MEPDDGLRRRAALKRVATERGAEAFLITMHHPAVWKPTAAQKRSIAADWAAPGVEVAALGFDLVRDAQGGDFHTRWIMDSPFMVQRLWLFGVKGTEAGVGPRFERRFFSLTAAEIRNARSDHLRLVFVKASAAQEPWLTGEEMLALRRCATLDGR